MLKRLRVPFAGAAAVGALALALVGQTSAAPTKLFGTVGPGFTISLKNAAGKKVTTLKPGTYAFVITDKASIHDWNLVGPGVNKTSGVAFVGKKTIVATLNRGSYKYQCSVHFFKGTFKVV